MLEIILCWIVKMCDARVKACLEGVRRRREFYFLWFVFKNALLLTYLCLKIGSSSDCLPAGQQ